MRRGMSCTCDLGDGAVPINWCAAHARAYRIAVEAEREACAKVAATFFDRPNLPRSVIAGPGAGHAIADAIRHRKE